MSFKKGFIRFLSLTILILLLSPNLFAVEKTYNKFNRSHFAGVRFGAWVLTADEAFQDSLKDFSRSSLFLEFFYDHRFSPLLAAEFSFGLYSQGDMQYNADAGIITSAAKLYPVFLSAKLYPFNTGGHGSLYPYLKVGGGMVYGTRDYSSSYYYYDPINYYIEETQFKMTYQLGAGFDWAVADQIGLNLDFNYTPIKFGEALAGLREYSGWSLKFGVGYIIDSKK